MDILPLELRLKILEFMNYEDIRSLILIKPNILIYLHLINNEDFAKKILNRLIKKNDINNFRLGRMLISNISNKQNSKQKIWLKNLKLRFESILPEKEPENKYNLRHYVRIIPKPEYFSQIFNHPDRNIVTEPSIIIYGSYEKKMNNLDLEKRLNMEFYYHNTYYNEMINKIPNIFAVRLSLIENKRQINIHGNIRIVSKYTNTININNFRSKIYLINRSRKKNIEIEIEINNYLKKKVIELPDVKELCTYDGLKNFCYYLLSIFLTIDISSKYLLLDKDYSISDSLLSGDLILKEMNEYMGNKTEGITELLFGNLNEIYIPKGNHISL